MRTGNDLGDDVENYVHYWGDYPLDTGAGSVTVMQCPSGMLIVACEQDMHGEPCYDPITGKEVFYPPYAEW